MKWEEQSDAKLDISDKTNYFWHFFTFNMTSTLCNTTEKLEKNIWRAETSAKAAKHPHPPPPHHHHENIT